MRGGRGKVAAGLTEGARVIIRILAITANDLPQVSDHAIVWTGIERVNLVGVDVIVG